MDRWRVGRRVRAVERVDLVGHGDEPHSDPAGRGDCSGPSVRAVPSQRNPLYVGLVALDVAVALLAPSFWALVFVPVGVVALSWGAIRPEERYLSGKFGSQYDAYR